MKTWRVVRSTSGRFWLERIGHQSTGCPAECCGESLFLQGPGDARRAVAALVRALGPGAPSKKRKAVRRG